MSFASLLINTCTVQRNTPGAGNDYGWPAESWADHLPDIDCRIMPLEGVELRIGAEVVIAEYKLFLNDVDITEQDRVVLDSITYEVLLVKDIQNGVSDHHKECMLRAVR